jgi:hypothetical protein
MFCWVRRVDLLTSKLAASSTGLTGFKNTGRGNPSPVLALALPGQGISPTQTYVSEKQTTWQFNVARLHHSTRLYHKIPDFTSVSQQMVFSQTPFSIPGNDDFPVTMTHEISRQDFTQYLY